MGAVDLGLQARVARMARPVHPVHRVPKDLRGRIPACRVLKDVLGLKEIKV